MTYSHEVSCCRFGRWQRDRLPAYYSYTYWNPNVLPKPQSLNWLFAALGFGLIVYGVALTPAITSGVVRSRAIDNARG